MLGDITVAENIYIACGYTDMRKSIDGLDGIVQQQFQLDPFSHSLFLFCGRNRNKMKALLWEGDGLTPLIKAALILTAGAGFDVYEEMRTTDADTSDIANFNKK